MDPTTRDEQLATCVGWFEDWETSTSDARAESERCNDFYHGIQWTAEELAIFKKRGQPPIVKNHVFKKVNFLVGMEIRNRSDPKTLPRTPMHDDDANAITDAIRYVCDKEKFPVTASKCWWHQLIDGSGGAVVEAMPAQDAYGQPAVEIKITPVEWDRIWVDLHSRKPDCSDATHLGMTHFADLNAAIATFAGKPGVVENYVEVLQNALVSSNYSGDETHDDKPRTAWTSGAGRRKRIRWTECYYQDLDQETRRMRWYFCAFVHDAWLIPPIPTGYLDEKGDDICPLVIESAFITRDCARYGLAKHLLGPQEDFNKRASKSLWRASTNQTIAEKGAVENIETFRIERARPDGVAIVVDDALAQGRIQTLPNVNETQAELLLMQEAKAEINSVGPDMPQLSGQTGTSGRQIMIRQQLSSLEIEQLVDQHRSWKREIYRHVYLAIRQFWTQERWMRVTDDAEDKGFRFVAVNRRMTLGQRLQELIQHGTDPQDAMMSLLGIPGAQLLQQASAQVQMMAQQAMQRGAQVDPQMLQESVMQLVLQSPIMAQPFTAANVAQLDVDVILDESPDVSILQQEEYESLMALMQTFLASRPDLAPSLLELAIDASQLRSKKRLLQMLKAPPDEQAMQMQQAMQQLGVEKAKGDAMKSHADAHLSEARAQQVETDTATTAPRLSMDAQKTQATVMRDSIEAGRRAVPSPPEPQPRPSSS